MPMWLKGVTPPRSAAVALGVIAPANMTVAAAAAAAAAIENH